MSKTRRRPRRRPPNPASSESQTAGVNAAEAVTVAWMLSLMATIAAQLLTGGVHLLVWIGGPDPPFPLNMLPGTLLLVAIVTGTLCLLLTPIVWRLRRDRPPALLVVLSVSAGVIPWLLLTGMIAVAAL